MTDIKRRTIALLTLAFGVSACDSGTAPEITGCTPDFARVIDTMAVRMAAAALQDAALVVRHQGRVVCRVARGRFRPDSAVFIASAAKWLTAGTVLAVVDRGLLRLDTRAIELFPAAPAATGEITVTQLLSHTSGLLWFSICMGKASYTLQSCAEQILEGDTHFPPGEGFYYGGTAFTVAGALAERATGSAWADVFRSAIAAPLDMRSTSYGGGPNPALSEGNVVSSADDYGRFAQMVLDDGAYRGRRVLSTASIAAMRRNWTSGIPVVYSPRGAIPYGLGVWLDARDAADNGVVISSPGIGGFWPVVDFDRRLVFVFQAEDDVARAGPVAVATLAAVRDVVDALP